MSLELGVSGVLRFPDSENDVCGDSGMELEGSSLLQSVKASKECLTALTPECARVCI